MEVITVCKNSFISSINIIKRVNVMDNSVEVDGEGDDQTEDAVVHVCHIGAVISVLVPEAPATHAHTLPSVVTDDNLH